MYHLKAQVQSDIACITIKKASLLDEEAQLSLKRSIKASPNESIYWVIFYCFEIVLLKNGEPYEIGKNLACDA